MSEENVTGNVIKSVIFQSIMFESFLFQTPIFFTTLSVMFMSCILSRPMAAYSWVYD